jgi:replication-associated recombination protein RarA
MSEPADADPWTRVETAHGFRADELISTLQKSIRRGLTEEAALVAYEMYVTSAELEEHVWRRLEVISVEDVGLANPQAPLLIEALYRMHARVPRPTGDRFLFLLHGVRLLAGSTKDRSTDEMANWITRVVASGERLPQVPDVALDMHTKRGRELGRDIHHFLREGAIVEPEWDERDRTYRERLLALLEQNETENNGAGGAAS